MKPSKLIEKIPILAVAFLAGSLNIVAHELAHHLSALALGLNSKMSAMSVQIAATRIRYQAITIISGPMVEIFLTIIGYIMFRKFRKEAPGSPLSLKEWCSFILGLACLRWVLQPVLAWTLKHRPTIGLSDEFKLSRILGLPSLTIPILAIIFGLIMFILLVRLHPSDTRKQALVLTVPSMVLGAYFWAILLGPLVFGLTQRSTRTLPPGKLVSFEHCDFPSPTIFSLAAPPVSAIR